MTTETVERPVEHGSGAGSRPGNRTFVVVLVAVVALVLGGLAGWLLRGDDGGVDDVVVVNGAELTDRQQQMLDIGDEYYTALREGDGDALASLFVPQGYSTIQGTQFRVDDGSLARVVNGGGNIGLQVYEPVLVFDDTLVYTMNNAGNTIEVMKFTPSGDVLIIRSSVTW
ncbi:MAG: hypothetical protein ACR2O6_09490 [Ilumatobacteraceae bacterium]